MVEAAGVELSNPLILCKLLVLQRARSAKNASLPGRRYKNGTKSGPKYLSEIPKLFHIEQKQHIASSSKSDMFSGLEGCADAVHRLTHPGG
jgi:hypothetical protein